jgi:hypothetical protein
LSLLLCFTLFQLGLFSCDPFCFFFGSNALCFGLFLCCFLGGFLFFFKTGSFGFSRCFFLCGTARNFFFSGF